LFEITNANELIDNNQITKMFLVLMTLEQVTSKKTLEETLKDIGMQVFET
jgi:hypothetical protein